MSQSKGKQHRVFFALWPNEAVRSALERYLHAVDVGGRRVPQAHLHLTLAFAGTVSAAQYDRIVHGAAATQCAPFALQLDWLDHFQGPRVQWLGPSAAPDALHRLATALGQVCNAAEVRLREAPFRPHVTLQRHVREPVRGPVAPALDWRIRDFVLVESGADGVPGRYRVMHRWPLCAAPEGGQ